MRICCVFALLAAAPLWASSFSLTSGAEAYASCGGSTVPSHQTGALAASASLNCGGSTGASAAAYVLTLRFGMLDVLAMAGAEVDPRDPRGSAWADVQASFLDTLTIIGSTGSGHLTWNTRRMSGGWSSGGFASPDTFDYGVPFVVSAWARARGYGPFPAGENAGGEFRIELLDLRITDDAGNLLPGTLQAASGTTYTLIAEDPAVPEPSTLMLLACGVTLLGAWRRTQRRTYRCGSNPT